MEKIEGKATRLVQMEQMLLAYPEGLTRAEIARRLGVHRSTTSRYVNGLEQMGVPIWTNGQRVGVLRDAYRIKVRMTMHEALAMHLAGRLLAAGMDKQNPHMASALRKLSDALKPLAPLISRHLRVSAELVEDQAKRQDPVFMNVLETLTRSWSEGRKVKVWHWHDKSDRVYEYFLSPYFLEPYAVGHTIHVIGFREPPGATRTLKVERIRRAEITAEHYTIPEDFDPKALLADAWGIWYTDEAPVEVVLRFHPRVVHRVKETQWHPSETLEDQPDGSVIWRAQVAEPQEMLPWIRGWGADVEVLAPETLREQLKRETRKLARLYEIMEPTKQLFAHFRERDKEYKEPQYLLDHLTAVSNLAGEFAGKIGLKDAGKTLGLLHDLGKASQEFQNYLLSGEGLIDPDGDAYVDTKAMKGKIDHSTAGAQVIFSKLWNHHPPMGNLAAQVMSLCIASHHSGLIDCIAPDGTNVFKKRIEKSDEKTHKTEALSNLQNIENDINYLLANGVDQSVLAILRQLADGADSKDTLAFKQGLLIRFLFSSLIDADRLDTADFEFPENIRIRNYGQYPSWGTLIARLDLKLTEFANNPERNPVDELRTQVSQACFEYAQKPKGIYQLTVPTGGGKTLASLRFALNHAKVHKMDRIFYIIPYTSIIDQNADEVRKILEERDKNGGLLDRVVLEHHSNLTPEEETRRQNLLAQNWDAPIVFTTQVQFLEALFGAGTRGARRMHQLANSVIILDEVQTVPIKTIHMLNVALRFLVHTCGASVVLSTATQPPLDKISAEYRTLTISSNQRIIQDEKELYERLKRVEVFDKRKTGGWENSEVADLVGQALQEKGSVLVVANTKKSARALYHAIADKKVENVLLCHLSTNMCPVHRLTVLDEIKEKLARREPIICVSTQLIEAGVDIDFGAVIRYLAGMDSIAQAAGRCNRNGRQDGLGSVWIVNPREENIEPLTGIKIGTRITERIMDDFRDNPDGFDNCRIGLKAMSAYYQYYFHDRRDEMRYKVSKDSSIGRDDDLFNLLSLNTKSVNDYQRTHNGKDPAIFFRQAFQSAAKAFHVIDSPTQGVIVPYGNEGKELIADLCGAFDLEKQFKLLKKAQRYSVNLFARDFQHLRESSAIHEVQEGTGVFYLDEQYYSNKFGWSDEPVGDMPTLIV